MASLQDTSLSLRERERRMFREIRSGNVPDFYRQLVEVTDTATVAGERHQIRYFVLPDFLALGSNDDYVYCPMTCMLAQRVANRLKCRLVTRRVSDRLYQEAALRLRPQPIPPSDTMTSVTVLVQHNAMVQAQRDSSLRQAPLGQLVAGHKKDVVLSDRMVNARGNVRVVIYGWHRPNGKAIQPLYNGHRPDWVDYSHGIRLLQRRVWVDGKPTTVRRVLRSDWHPLLSDEGPLRHTRYPTSRRFYRDAR
ncbi:hypothetical protein SAMN05421823_104540 [Catalinimonas alkaloidigena]|uniref:Uncharacterized protein n=2 Tax=Catalinimonas alkaloidigena TaxID=1075417 RepID=A0A1G9HUN4_9BACT|nr:hypothetical protein SAMN05421823_104540 [Catalinimonas alkaloidigena]